MTQDDPNDSTARRESKGFDVLYVSHAKSILTAEFSSALTERADVLVPLELPMTGVNVA